MRGIKGRVKESYRDRDQFGKGGMKKKKGSLSGFGFAFGDINQGLLPTTMKLEARRRRNLLVALCCALKGLKS